jgi:PAS domain-containing protein
MVSKNHLNDFRVGEFFHALHDPLRCDYGEAEIIRLSAFIRDHPHPVLVFSPTGEVIKANPAAERLRHRLQIEWTDLLPVDHLQAVRQCLSGRGDKHTAEVTVQDQVFVLTYDAFISRKVAYFSAIDVTKYRQAEAEFLQLANYALDRVKLALLHWQSLCC